MTSRQNSQQEAKLPICSCMGIMDTTSLIVQSGQHSTSNHSDHLPPRPTPPKRTPDPDPDLHPPRLIHSRRFRSYTPTRISQDLSQPQLRPLERSHQGVRLVNRNLLECMRSTPKLLRDTFANGLMVSRLARDTDEGCLEAFYPTCRGGLSKSPGRIGSGEVTGF